MSDWQLFNWYRDRPEWLFWYRTWHYTHPR